MVLPHVCRSLAGVLLWISGAGPVGGAHDCGDRNLILVV